MFITVGVVLVLLIGAFLIYKRGQQAANESNQYPSAQTTSTAPTAQSNFSGGNDRPISDSNKNEGTVTDNEGNVGETPSQDQWTTSNSGQITIYMPAKDSVIKDGDKITGVSSLSTVNFRLIDDATGVIAEGRLNVVNGKFAGTFDFSTTATEGRIDVYSTRADGTEFSNIEIPIRFK